LSPDRELALRGDVNLHLLDDAGIDFVASLNALHLLVLLLLQFLELLFEGAEISLILLRIGEGFDLDAIVNRREFAQQASC
jgi:hypothetical protein